MTKASMFDVLRTAGDGAVGAFNVITLEHAEGIIAGAADAGRPVVLQISENTVDYHGGLAPLGLACMRLATDASVPVVVHLDHATRPALVEAAVSLGIGSVMVDASTLPYDENVALTYELARWCHDRGVFVEAELGEIGGKDGAHAPGVRTDPDEAASFVAATSVDSLAVAVGSSHAMLTRDASLDDDLIRSLAKRLEVPLVLHGSSGVSDTGLRAAVANGIRKVNVATHLNAAMTAAIRGVLDGGDVVDPRTYMGPGRDAVATAVSHLLTLLATPAPE